MGRLLKMAYSHYNPNPVKNNTRDCAIRAVAKALNITWEESFSKIAAMAFSMGETMDANAAWGAVLRMNGFKRDVIPNTCPDCYTAKDFCKDHNKGIFVLGFGNHVATVVDGILYDSTDTSDEIPQYFWYKDEASKGA
jgi:hypothetical protein